MISGFLSMSHSLKRTNLFVATGTHLVDSTQRERYHNLVLAIYKRENKKNYFCSTFFDFFTSEKFGFLKSLEKTLSDTSLSSHGRNFEIQVTACVSLEMFLIFFIGS